MKFFSITFRPMKIVLLLLFLIPFCVFSQLSQEIQEELESHFQMANQYNGLALYGESIGELDQIIKIARQYNLEETRISATIKKAEIFRKTQNFARGITLLESLKNTKLYPKLHVQKLGRFAALYAENGDLDHQTQDDSIKVFIDEGIALAVEFNFKEEEAGLRNELGFRQTRSGNYEEGLNNLLKAAELYKAVHDTINEVSVLTNVLDAYVNERHFDEFDSLYPILVERVENTEWYAIRSNLYRIIAAPFIAHRNETEGLRWLDLSHENTVRQIEKTNTAQMAAFKIIHDTNLYKEDALKKSRELENEFNKTKELYFFITILVLVIVIVVLIFFRERRLKRTLNTTVSELNTLNEKYQMLMVESNHRIKNNLQMIISMLEYTKKQSKNLDPKFVLSISSKIRTISALHKHLYLDVHNGLVELSTFFSEITEHYDTIGMSYTIKHEVCPVQIEGERIVYFGLILNEMLANTLQHAKDVEKVFIKVSANDKGYILSYSDGSSHPNDAKSGTGIKLIEQLVRRVNGTDYKLDITNGTYEFSFNS